MSGHPVDPSSALGRRIRPLVGHHQYARPHWKRHRDSHVYVEGYWR